MRLGKITTIRATQILASNEGIQDSSLQQKEQRSREQTGYLTIHAIAVE
jgi:hypothetical protein